MFDQRMERVRRAMAAQGVDAVLLSVGPDLPWLIGYDAMPLERLSMLVVTQHDRPKLVLPAFEAPRVVERPDLFEIVGWGETQDPIAIVASAIPASGSLAVGDHVEPVHHCPPASRFPRRRGVQQAPLSAPYEQ
ncbi:MAG: aminopeptidase P family N-terminal domain-containing protein [Acidimicrobiales bacterium]